MTQGYRKQQLPQEAKKIIPRLESDGWTLAFTDGGGGRTKKHAMSLQDSNAVPTRINTVS